jgi:hypothetical protein
MLSGHDSGNSLFPSSHSPPLTFEFAKLVLSNMYKYFHSSVRGAEDSPEEARSSPETGEAPTAADEQQQEQGEEEGRNGIAAAVDQQQQEENAQINGELAGSRKGTAEGRKLESANGKVNLNGKNGGII